MREAIGKQAHEELEKKIADLEKALLRAETERDIYRVCLMRESFTASAQRAYRERTAQKTPV